MNGILRSVKALSPNCKEAVRLQSEAMDHQLSSAQRVGLKIHLLMCGFCRRYGVQIRALRQAARGDQSLPTGGLSDEARRRMKEKLRGKAG